MTRFTAEDAERAYEEWGCNCGPAALAAIMDLTLDEVRPFMGDFETKRYTNPTLMLDSMKRCGAPWRKSPILRWPTYGLVRIQWGGPWTAPGVPIRARYRYTHWVGAWTGRNGSGVFDINALGNGTAWCAQKYWMEVIVPHITSTIPRADGKWWLTHSIEVDRAAVFGGRVG